jgi:hypothetical protein
MKTTPELNAGDLVEAETLTYGNSRTIRVRLTAKPQQGGPSGTVLIAGQYSYFVKTDTIRVIDETPVAPTPAAPAVDSETPARYAVAIGEDDRDWMRFHDKDRALSCAATYGLDADAVHDTQPDATARDWAILAVTTTVLSAADQAAAEEVAAEAEHLTAITRVPGGDWQPVTTPDAEPTRYAFLVEGDLTCGTFADYVKEWKSAHTASGHISPDVRTWAGAAFTVGVEYLGVDDDDWMRYRLSLGGETAHVTVDGRS